MKKNPELCGRLIHTRGWEGMPGPLTCAEPKPCKFHPDTTVTKPSKVISLAKIKELYEKIKGSKMKRDGEYY